ARLVIPPIKLGVARCNSVEVRVLRVVGCVPMIELRQAGALGFALSLIACTGAPNSGPGLGDNPAEVDGSVASSDAAPASPDSGPADEVWPPPEYANLPRGLRWVRMNPMFI